MRALRRDLLAALLRHEKAALARANLERLRAQGAVPAADYEQLAASYAAETAVATATVDDLRARAADRAEAGTRELSTLADQLRQLSLRRDVGEIAAAEAERQARRLELRQSRGREEIATYRALAAATSSADPVLSGPRSAEAPAHAALTVLQDLAPAASGLFRLGRLEELTQPRSKLVGLAAGALLLLSALAPWVSPRLGAVNAHSAAGSELTSWLLVVGLLGFAGALWAARVESPRARGLLHLALGGSALLVGLIVVLVLSFGRIAVEFDNWRAFYYARDLRHLAPYTYLSAAAVLALRGWRELRGPS